MTTAVLVDEFVELTSAAAEVQSAPVRTGGNPLVVQIIGPAALGGLQGSADRLNWAVLDDEAGDPITLKANAVVHLPHTPMYVRRIVAIDVSQPRLFTTIIGVIKDSV